MSPTIALLLGVALASLFWSRLRLYETRGYLDKEVRAAVEIRRLHDRLIRAAQDAARASDERKRRDRRRSVRCRRWWRASVGGAP